MSKRIFPAAATIALAAALWVVPSVGTRGQGTLNHSFSHVDEALVGKAAASQQLVRRADARVAQAVRGL